MRFYTLLIITLFSGIQISCAYSILTHEAVVDAAWDKNIAPLLKQRYPAATDEQMKEARAYAYGGAVAPDMGYYPKGSELFTDLVHYVRSGDLVMAMLEEADSINEYAFALGFLAHYYADNFGHPIGINRSVPVIFPKLKKKYGDTILYNQDHVSHVRTELSFDVLQMVRSNYNTQNYHDYIGFKVSEPVLKKAFAKTYGLQIEDIFPDFSKAVNTFRWSVEEVFPYLTRTAWKNKKQEILKSAPATTRRNYIYRVRYSGSGTERKKPGLCGRIMIVVIRFLPKVGSLKKLKIVVPGPEAEKLLVQSFDTVVIHYMYALSNVNNAIPDKDFDTGKNTEAGEYNMADETYADLLLKLQENNFVDVPGALRQNIITFYNSPQALIATQRYPKKIQKITTALEQLKNKG